MNYGPYNCVSINDILHKENIVDMSPVGNDVSRPAGNQPPTRTRYIGPYNNPSHKAYNDMLGKQPDDLFFYISILSASYKM